MMLAVRVRALRTMIALTESANLTGGSPGALERLGFVIIWVF